MTAWIPVGECAAADAFSQSITDVWPLSFNDHAPLRLGFCFALLSMIHAHTAH